METPPSLPTTEDHAEPHSALFLALIYLRLPELLACQRVCRPLRDAVAGDWLLWRSITVEPPLSSRLTDEALLKITSNAGGKLTSLALLDCWRITDAGLLRVVDRNPGITKLFVPGCTYLTADGVVRVVKRLTEHNGSLNCLRIYGIRNIRKQHLDILNTSLWKNNSQQGSQPFVYNNRRSLPLNSDDGCPIDVNVCPKCNNAGLVFDCTREACRKHYAIYACSKHIYRKIECRVSGQFFSTKCMKSMNYRLTECRGCVFCIARCEECGGCINHEEYGEETVCLHLLCLECWLPLPKCNMCNRPYCKGHLNFQVGLPNSAGFVCEQCRESEAYSYGFC